MISIHEAEQIIKAHIPQSMPETKPLRDSLGYFLAQDIMAPEPLPHFDNSAMDGFAVALPDSDKEETMTEFPIIGESRAGLPFDGALKFGTAVRISTGAMVPENTDLVVPIENTEVKGQQVRVVDMGSRGAHIRRKGEEVDTGDILVKRSSLITPPVLSWLGTFGIVEVPVYRKPDVAILTTGQELVDASQEIKPGQIRNSNQLYLETFVESLHLKVAYSGRVPDSLEETMASIKAASEVADIILISGGVSVGPHDHVKEAAENLGFQRHFWKVTQKPGKPMYFATGEDTLVFGLPGNPVSTLVNTLRYFYPAANEIMGNPVPELRRFAGRLESSLTGMASDRTRYFLVKILRLDASTCRLILEPVPLQHSHMLSGVTSSDGFIIIPPNTDAISDREELEIYLYPWTTI